MVYHAIWGLGMFPQQDAFGVYDPTMPSLLFLSGHSCTSEKNMQVAVGMVRVDCRMSFQLDGVEPMVRGAKNYLEGIQTASRSLSILRHGQAQVGQIARSYASILR